MSAVDTTAAPLRARVNPLRAWFAKARPNTREQAIALWLALGAWCVIVAMVFTVSAPFLGELHKWGWHDWDSTTVARWMTVVSIKRYFQFPFWNPYSCGGYGPWGYVEGGGNVISPWLPVYLLAPLPI